MSFRNTFVTDFIYGANNASNANALGDVFKKYTSSLSSEMNASGMGYFAGIIGTLNIDVDLSELGLSELVSELEKTTKTPFRLTVLQESGAIITYNIEPRSV